MLVGWRGWVELYTAETAADVKKWASGEARGANGLAASGKKTAAGRGRGRKAGELLVSLQWSGQPERREALRSEFEADFAKGGKEPLPAEKKGKGPFKGFSSKQKVREAEMDARLQNLWAGVDVDGSGSLDHVELRKVLRQLHGDGMADKQFEKAVKQMDKDNSGGIDFNEFQKW